MERASDYALQLGLGALMGMHWWTYFVSMQVSTVAIGLISRSTAPVLTVFLEPACPGAPSSGSGRPARGGGAVRGLPAGAGVFVADAYLRGVVYGMASAGFLSLRNILHRQGQRGYGGVQLMIYQVLGVIPLFLVLSMIRPLSIQVADAGKLVLLGMVFTAVPHTLIAVSLRHLPARSVILITSMMLVYGTLLAWWLLGETPLPRTLAGGAVIAGCAMIENLQARALASAATVAPLPSAGD